jgi:hypothetical protein
VTSRQPQNIQREILSLTSSLIAQKHFPHTDISYVQTEGRPCHGSPTSSLLSEIYIQHLKITKIADILLHHILGYFRYDDDILIAYSMTAQTYSMTAQTYSMTAQTYSMTARLVLSKFNNLNPTYISPWRVKITTASTSYTSLSPRTKTAYPTQYTDNPRPLTVLPPMTSVTHPSIE